MNIEPVLPTKKNPPEKFAGDVWLDPIALPESAIAFTSHLPEAILIP